MRDHFICEHTKGTQPIPICLIQIQSGSGLLATSNVFSHVSYCLDITLLKHTFIIILLHMEIFVRLIFHRSQFCSDEDASDLQTHFLMSLQDHHLDARHDICLGPKCLLHVVVTIY